MDPATIGAIASAGASIFGSLFGGGKKPPAPKYSGESQDVLFGDLLSTLANYGSPVVPALIANSGLEDKLHGMFGPQTGYIMNPYGLGFPGATNPSVDGSAPKGLGGYVNVNYQYPRGARMGVAGGAPLVSGMSPLTTAGFGLGGGNMGGYTAGAPKAWSQRPFFSA